MYKVPTIEEMLKAGLHFGHRTSKWHPKMAPYIFGSRNGVHVIDLTKSQLMLAQSLELIKKMSAEGKIILFVGTKDQVKKPMKMMAEEAGMPYVTEKWLGGLLTNFTVIKKLIKKYGDLQSDKKFGKLDKYTKKERLGIDREIAKLELRVGGLSNLTKTPDAIFVWDIKTEKTALAEAMKRKVPVIAVCDTNTNPTGIKHIIPANDDATKGIKLVLSVVKDAILDGKAEASKK
jgi:small subunit ribosomal protein S2